MSRYVLTREALDDLWSIWSFIAADDPRAADRVESALEAAFQFVSESPLRGHLRPDLTPLPVRFWTPPRYPRYVVVYRPDTSPLQILRVLHGAMDITAQLDR